MPLKERLTLSMHTHILSQKGFVFVWVHFPANTLPVFEHKMHLNPDSSFFLGKFNFPFPFENIHNRHPEAV